MNTTKKIKNYRKKPSKLIQIRLSETEYKKVIEFFKGIEETRRSWLLSKIGRTIKNQ